MIPPTASNYRLRPLTADDNAALQRFRCAGGGPWAFAVERYIRTVLERELVGGHVRATGLWNGNFLAAVIVFTMEPAMPALCRCHYLAVAASCRRQGCGERLKTWLLDEAWKDGRTAVLSRVHRDNIAMLSLNDKLGAHILDPEDDDHRPCIIDHESYESRDWWRYRDDLEDEF